MKKSSKKTLEKRGILIAGRAQNAGSAQIHADKRRIPRNLEKQRLKTQLQHETARNRGPFPFLSRSLATENTKKAQRGSEKSQKEISVPLFEFLCVLCG